MPSRAKSICRHPGCGKLIESPGYCERHAKQVRQQSDAERGSAAERGYTSAWTKARTHYLRAHPLCVYCERLGRVVAASVVDHIKPHRWKQAMDSGDERAIEIAKALFWDSSNNWQSLCKPHHDITKAREE